MIEMEIFHSNTRGTDSPVDKNFQNVALSKCNYSKHDVNLESFHDTSSISYHHQISTTTVSLVSVPRKLMKSCANYSHYKNLTSLDIRYVHRQNSSSKSFTSLSMPSSSSLNAHRKFFDFCISLLVTYLFAFVCLSSIVSASQSTVDNMNPSDCIQILVDSASNEIKLSSKPTHNDQVIRLNCSIPEHSDYLKSSSSSSSPSPSFSSSSFYFSHDLPKSASSNGNNFPHLSSSKQIPVLIDSSAGEDDEIGEGRRSDGLKHSSNKYRAKSLLSHISSPQPFKSASLLLSRDLLSIASSSLSSSSSSSASASSDERPRFLETFHDTMTEPKSRISLKCIATGNPLPQITWTLDGGPIAENHRVRVGDFVSNEGLVNSFVNITSITVREGGLYSCAASNGRYTAHHSARITVYGTPYVKPMDNVTILSGTTVYLQCPFSGHPIQSIEWYRRSNRLPENRRQLIYPNGTLIIKSADRLADQDRYKCIVHSDSGDSASGEVYLRIRIAPLINIDSPSNLREGMRSMLTCNVLEGDPPFNFAWYKDGSPISMDKSMLNSHYHYQNMNISSLNEYSSTLFISELNFKDSGNYTCIISNDVAYANSTVNMLVKVPPKWILTPSDTDVILGDDVTVDCQASGYPQPRIWWEHAKSVTMTTSASASSMASSSSSSSSLASSSHSSPHSHPPPTHYQTVISNSHIHALENGSLTIKDVSKMDAGYYLCQATNGIGSDISKVIRILVHVPAFFEHSFTSKTIKKGDSLELRCEAGGERPLTITWNRDRIAFDPRKDARYNLLVNEKESTLEHILQIRSADRQDSVLFTCVAINAYGKDEYSTQVILQESPDKIDHIMITNVESRSAVISWTIPYSGNSMILFYQVECKLAHHDWNSKEKITETITGSLNTLTLRNLQPITSYQLRMRAQNSIGFSDYSEMMQFTTDEEAPSLPPMDVKVYPLTSRSLQVTWKPVDPVGQFGMIKGYYLGYRKHGSDDSYIFKTITGSIKSSLSSSSLPTRIPTIVAPIEDSVVHHPANTASNSLSGTSSISSNIWEVKIDDLQRSTKYGIIVQAFNGKGPGPQCEEVIGETLANDPPPAPSLVVGDIGFSHITLKWSFDQTLYDKEDLLINGYNIHYKSYRSDWLERQVAGHLNSIRMDNLDCGTAYQFYVNAYNNLGKGDPSQVIQAKTIGSVPLAPSMENFIKVNSTSVHLQLSSWKTMGCPISHFEIQYKPKVQPEWALFSNSISGEETFVVLNELKMATWYALSISGHTQAGTTQREYIFATLTNTGGTVAPLDRSKPQQAAYSTLSLMIPTTCAVIVMIVILLIALLLIHRRRPQIIYEGDQVMIHGDGSISGVGGSGTSEGGGSMMICRDDRLLNSESYLLNHHLGDGKDQINEYTDNVGKIYLPTPYASNQVGNGKYGTIGTSNFTPTSTTTTATLAKHALTGHHQSLPSPPPSSHPPAPHHFHPMDSNDNEFTLPMPHHQIQRVHHHHEHIPLYERYQVT
ncbi:cell adhesion molecule Dscam1-like [Brevipalpus obovatus]|uniref:cell adhesion molecule Dscam1-like n=1 Tax=Brevipalpus obovatus TaxID=246614 RepID=UPI003D9E76C0